MSKSFTYAIALAKVKALGEGTVFYASDIGALGGTMNALAIDRYIEKTGNTKSYLVEVYDKHYIETEVFEWRVHDAWANDEYLSKWREKEFKKIVDSVLEASEVLHSLGY